MIRSKDYMNSFKGREGTITQLWEIFEGEETLVTIDNINWAIMQGYLFVTHLNKWGYPIWRVYVSDRNY